MWSYLTQMDVDVGLEFFKHIVIETTIIPDMYPEFGGGGTESHKILSIDTHEKKIDVLSCDEAKELYKHVVGKRNRILFWRVLRDMKDGLYDM